MNKNIFWIKAIFLIGVTVLCIWYLTFAFILQFYTVTPGSDRLMHYFMIILHLLVILICILYMIEKIVNWKKKYITKN